MWARVRVRVRVRVRTSGQVYHHSECVVYAAVMAHGSQWWCGCRGARDGSLGSTDIAYREVAVTGEAPAAAHGTDPGTEETENISVS